MDKSSENVSFEPSTEQIKFLEIYLEFNKKTNKEIAEEIGISDRTIYRWFNDDDFVSWVNSHKTKMLNKSFADRIRVAIKKAAAGDFQFSKLLFEMTGDYMAKSETKVTNVYQDYENKSDEEIIKEFELELNSFRASKMDRKDNTAKKT